MDWNSKRTRFGLSLDSIWTRFGLNLDSTISGTCPRTGSLSTRISQPAPRLPEQPSHWNTPPPRSLPRAPSRPLASPSSPQVGPCSKVCSLTVRSQHRALEHAMATWRTSFRVFVQDFTSLAKCFSKNWAILVSLADIHGQLRDEFCKSSKCQPSFFLAFEANKTHGATLHQHCKNNLTMWTHFKNLRGSWKLHCSAFWERGCS